MLCFLKNLPAVRETSLLGVKIIQKFVIKVSIKKNDFLSILLVKNF